MIENPDTEPLVVEEVDPHQDTGGEIPGRYLLYDAFFPLDSRTKGTVENGPLRMPNVTLKIFNDLILGFGTTPEWLRNRIRSGKTSDGFGNEFPFKRLKGGGRAIPDRGGEYRLTLPDCERLLHRLYDNNQIDGVRLAQAVRVCVAMARVWDVKPHAAKSKVIK